MNFLRDTLFATFGVIQDSLGALPKNGALWSYSILGLDGSRYVDRTIFPRVAGHRIVFHRIHRADREPWMHDHPWRTARFLIVSGGYVEERLRGLGMFHWG